MTDSHIGGGFMLITIGAWYVPIFAQSRSIQIRRQRHSSGEAVLCECRTEAVPLEGRTKGTLERTITSQLHLQLPPCPPMVAPSKRENVDWYCEYHGDKGHYTNNCFHLKKQLKTALESGKLNHLVKDMRQQGNNRGRQTGSSNNRTKVINMRARGKFLGYMVTSEGIRANPKKTKAIADMQSPKTLKEMQSLSGKLAALNWFLSKSTERALSFFKTLKNITKENKEEYWWSEEAEQAFQELKKLILELPVLTMPKAKETLYLL
ncbi:hypothetical protein Tco_1483643 [Tanacetum coccineum]